ncbi:glycosyltransferase [Actinomycetospora sp. C-140]
MTDDRVHDGRGTAPPGAPARSRISLFTEARFRRTEDGSWRALHHAEAASIARFAGAERDVVVVARATTRPTDGDGVPVDASVQPLPYYVGPLAFVAALPRLVPAVLRAVRTADRIVLRMPGTIGSLAAVGCRLTGRRYAVEVVGDPVAVMRSGVLGAGGHLLAGLFGRQMQWVVRGASSAVYVTEKTLQSTYPPSVGTVSAGISDIRLSREMVADRPPSAHPGSFHLVTVGHQDQHYKGHDVLLRAIALLRRNGVDVRATVIGGGRLHEELRTLRDQLSLGPWVELTDTLNDRKAVTTHLDSATLFVLPSRTEGLPRALIEAMARGLPAVASRVGGVPELLGAECLVPPGDPGSLARKIGALLADPQQRIALGRRNLEHARRFDAATLERRWGSWVDALPASMP